MPIARGDLDTQVRDTFGVVDLEDLHDVVLVTHSCGTVLFTGVADRVPVAITTSIWTNSLLPAGAPAPC